MRLSFFEFGRRAALPLLLIGALAGFVLLINLLASLTASGPDDLLASKPASGDYFTLPSSAQMFAFTVTAVGLVVAVVVLSTLFHWSQPGRRGRLLRFLFYVLVSVAAVGLYYYLLPTFGQAVAGPGVGEPFLATRIVDTKWVVMLTCFFFSLALVGAFATRLLPIVLVVWLVFGLFSGLFDYSRLQDLGLVNQPEQMPVSAAFAAEVEKHRGQNAESEFGEAIAKEGGQTGRSNESPLEPDSPLFVGPRVIAGPSPARIAEQQFVVTGAEHTTLLRTATGDVYRNGAWTQLDPMAFEAIAGSDLPAQTKALINEGIVVGPSEGAGSATEQSYKFEEGELLVGPDSSIGDAIEEFIMVSPAPQFEQLDQGVLPVPALLRQVGLTGEMRPFSGTFVTSQPATSNQSLSLVTRLSESELSSVGPVEDPAYLALPEDLPVRVAQLASEVTAGLDTPYAKATAIADFLKTEYSVITLTSNNTSLQAPVNADPVDWFLFEHSTGRSSTFSSAFVILARAVGVPARVVAGWSINPIAEEQEVTYGQAHQWAEIGLKGVGWVTFDLVPNVLDDPSRAASADVEDGDDTATDQKGKAGNESGLKEKALGLGVAATAKMAVALLELAGDVDPGTRAEAARLLGEIGAGEAFEGLAMAMLQDPHPLVQEAALEALGRMDFELLARTLLEDEDALLRIASAAALAQGDDPAALAQLIEALANDLSPEVKIAAAEALGELAAEGALDPLVESLLSGTETNEEVLAAVASALADLELDGALPPLLQALAADQDPAVQAAAAKALGELGLDGATDGLVDALLEGDDSLVRAAAAEALGDIQNPGALPGLQQAVDGDGSPEVMAAASAGLDSFELPELAGALLGSEDAEVRAAAAELLGERGLPEAAGPLIESLSDPEESVRDAAVEGLQELGPVAPLENGGGLLALPDGQTFIPGATSQQASELPRLPVFEVEGAAGIDFLRTAVGDRYDNGAWIPLEATKLQYSSGSTITSPDPVSFITVSPARQRTVRVTVAPPEEGGKIPGGIVPTSPLLTGVTADGTFRPASMTFTIDTNVESYSWTATMPAFSSGQLNTAADSSQYEHTSAISEMPERIRLLAEEITEGHAAPYAKAVAIEKHLKANYTYRFADPLTGGIPPGSDPVDWFLFEGLEGTCGNFSTAFVVLARSVGLPARVVSGWAITPTADAQVVYSDQAHQRAEVAFEGLGWILFEPTASGSAPNRATQNSQAGGVQEQSKQQELESLVEELAVAAPEAQAQAREELEELGAEVQDTETGGNLVSRDGQPVGFSAGTTTSQAAEPSQTPLFVVTGSGHTRYLREGVGEVYADGSWQPLSGVSLAYQSETSIPSLVLDGISSGSFSGGSQSQSNPELLSRFEVNPPVTYTDTIRIEPVEGSRKILAGLAPTSLFLDQLDRSGKFMPFSATFSLNEGTDNYTWVAQIPQFSPGQLSAARAVSDPQFTQLPDNLPERIRTLALEVTKGQTSPYGKAGALETYLKTNYAYAFADPSGGGRPPSSRDPVDWFLFDHKEGTCGVFSSAFVVMARSIGLPARVVSGWAVSDTEEPQTVKLNQAHQWAEVAFEGLGWLTFDPTGSGGAPSRADLAAAESLSNGTVQAPQGQGQPQPEPDGNFGSEKGGPESSEIPEIAQEEEPEQQDPIPEESEPAPSPVPQLPVATVIEILHWPLEIERDLEFTVGGAVLTVGGSDVDGVAVEIFVNETKEHGGTKLGETVARNGAFEASVKLPLSMDRGNYQLLAHAISNDNYLESWSDPGISVYSQAGMEFTGVNEVEVDNEAVFEGRLFDDTGAGIANLELLASVDSRNLPPLTTGPAGEFAFLHTFTDPGPHEVKVLFEGGDLLRANSARLDLFAVLPAVLSGVSLGQVEVEEGFRIEGFLHDVRGNPLSAEEVSVSVGSNPELVAVTDDSGKFEVDYTIAEAGEHLVSISFGGDYPVLPVETSRLVVARHVTSLSIAGPAVISLGDEAAFHGRIDSSTLEGIGTRQVLILDAAGNELGTVNSDADGFFKYILSSTDLTGTNSLTALFQGEELLSPSSATASYSVRSPTLLTVGGPDLVQPGDIVQIEGRLLLADGGPVSGVKIWRQGAGGEVLVTGDDGVFSLEIPANAELAASSVEAQVDVSLGFDGNDHFAPALAVHRFTVGIPWIAAEPPGTVARGETAALRGYVFVGNTPQQGTTITLEDELQVESSSTGAFVLRYPVESDAPLGESQISLSAPALGVGTVTSLEVKSATNLIVVPLEKVRKGREVPLQVTLYDDNGNGIAGANLTNSQGLSAVTGEQGMALMSLTVPEADDLLAVPVTFSFGGDDLHLPLTYFTGVPVTPTSFNWILWVVTPFLLVATAASWFVAFKWGRPTLALGVPFLSRVAVRLPRRREPDAVEQGEAIASAQAQEPAQLSISLHRPAPDLPAVWAPGEEVGIEINLSDEEGAPLPWHSIGYQDPGGSNLEVEADQQGSFRSAWLAELLGEYTVSATFGGSQVYEASSASQDFRVVDFREEIVRLYQEFLEWAEIQAPGAMGLTPREAESKLVATGQPLDYRALDEIISRFEEADYSEHDITRAQYEVMFRSWRILREE